MHPAQVPLEAEAQPAQVHRPGHARPRGGLLGDHHDPGDPPVAGRVDLLQQGHRVGVLPAALGVRDPLPGLAGVVQVEHGRHRVDPEPVGVEFLQPVHGVGHEEVADLGPAVVEDERAPVRVLAPARVGVLVERGAVEPGQRPLVAREVRGHPVEDHADPGLVQPVDQVAELVGGAEPGRGREVGGDLVPPGPAERVLGHRQELHVGEAHLGDVPGQLVGELDVGQAGPPRPQVHLVHADRLADLLAAAPGRQPLRVVPLVPRGVDDRRGRGRLLGQVGHRVGLAPPLPVRPAHVELVVGPVAHVGQEQFPDAGAAQGPHRVAAAVPVVEVADDPHAAGVGRPDRERRPGHRAVLLDVRAEHLPQVLVPALADQVQVHLAQAGQEAVRVVGDDLGQGAAVAVGIGHRDPVVRRLARRDGGREHALVHVLGREPLPVGQHDRHRLGQRAQHPHDDPVRAGVGAEDRVRVVVGPGDHAVDFTQADPGRVLLADHAHASAMEPSGMDSQPGRFRASYITS